MRCLAPPEAKRLLRILLVWMGPLSPDSGERRARLLSMTREPAEPFEVLAFRYKDARTGRWVKASYKTTPDEIAARYAEWE